jgi:hypothetical protein
MKVCKNCQHGVITSALEGKAEQKKTTADKLPIVYCLEEREYKDKYHACGHFIEKLK